MRDARRTGHRVLQAFVAAAAGIGMVLQGVPAGAQQPAPPRAGLVWIIGLHSLQRLRAVPGSQALIRTFFSAGRYSILVGGAHGSVPALHAKRSPAFGSYQTLKVALARRLPDGSGTRLVILDLEHWSLTPRIEQRHPARYYRLAFRTAKRKGFLLLATPSANLVRARSSPSVPGFTAFLRSGLIGRVARTAAIVEVQAQGFERSTSLYRQFVQDAADQARDANPHVAVIAGLSTNPGGRGVPAAQLRRDALAVRPYVDGFWLNIPRRSRACPRCGVARPDIAAGLLVELMRDRAFLPGAAPGQPKAPSGPDDAHPTHISHVRAVGSQDVRVAAGAWDRWTY